jgi:hypothetical protein
MLTLNAAGIAARLGNHRQEGAYWRCRCPVHGGISLTLGDGSTGRLFIRCWYGCRRDAVVAALVQRGLITSIGRRSCRRRRRRGQNAGGSRSAEPRLPHRLRP